MLIDVAFLVEGCSTFASPKEDTFLVPPASGWGRWGI